MRRFSAYRNARTTFPGSAGALLGRSSGGGQAKDPFFMRTFVASAKSVDSRWHVIDADGQVLGRVATLAAKLLQGKHKATYIPFIDRSEERRVGKECRSRWSQYH